MTGRSPDIVDAAHAGACYRSSRNSAHPVFDHHGAAYYIATRNKLIAWHGDMVRRMAHEPFQAILSWMPPRILCARVHTHPHGHAHVCTHAHACAYTHVCRHAHTHMHTHTYAHTCKQLAVAEEKSETLMQLAISLTPSCRCSLSSWRCSLSSWSCFFWCSKSDTWPSSFVFSTSVAAALHSASSLLCWADWLPAWRQAIPCRERT